MLRKNIRGMGKTITIGMNTDLKETKWSNISATDKKFSMGKKTLGTRMKKNKRDGK